MNQIPTHLSKEHLMALETHLRLRTLADDWDALGMEAYDAPLVQRDPVSETFQPKTELGKKLLALRRAYVAKGGLLLDADTFDRELQRRRGGVSGQSPRPKGRSLES